MLPAQHSLDEVATAFADRIAELQELTLLRVHSTSRVALRIAGLLGQS